MQKYVTPPQTKAEFETNVKEFEPTSPIQVEEDERPNEVFFGGDDGFDLVLPETQSQQIASTTTATSASTND